MDWAKQQRSMLQLWMDVQQEMWQTWTGQQPNQAYKAMLDMWTQSLDQWMQAADPMAQTLGQQMLSGQHTMLNLFEMATASWQHIGQAMQNGDDWPTALNQEMARVRAQAMLAATDTVKSMTQLQQFWQDSMGQWGQFSAPWVDAMQKQQHMMPDAMRGDRDAMLDMTGLSWDAYRQTFGELLQAPGVGYTREFDEKMRRAAAAGMDVQESVYEYQVIIVDGWLKAYERMLNEMREMAEQGQNFESLRDFLKHYSVTGDNVLKDVFRTDKYVQAQGKMINAIMAYRLRQRDLNEEMLEYLDMPTRGEVDEAHRRIYELRKEMKALRKELADLKKKPRATSRKKKSASQGE